MIKKKVKIMGEVVSLNKQNEVQKVENSEINLLEVAEGILLDTRTVIEKKQVMSMPIAELATLGTAVSSLLPAFRTITETTTIHADGLYRLANESVGDVLKAAKDGTFWGSFKTAEGNSKFVKLQEANMAPATTTAVMPLDPATMMIAVALFSIEQKMNHILEMEKQILSFLQIEKESKIEADMEMLTSTLKKYKYDWNNEHFIASSHKLTMDIQRSSRGHMLSYQKAVSEMLNAKKCVISQSKVNDMLDDLLKKFKYYRLSLYIFSMASFMEVMLSGDFKEIKLRSVQEDIEKQSLLYRDTFDQCSAYLEKMSDLAIDTTIAKGIGTAGKAVGKLIENIPVLKEGPVDEFLQESGDHLKKDAARMERKAAESFAALSNPGVGVFVEKMNDMIQIYTRTENIYFDKEMIYLVAG